VRTDILFNSFEFVSETEIVAADVQVKFTFIKNIEDESTTTITLINTKVARFREIKSFPDSGVLVGVSTDGKICFYDVEQLRKFHLEIGNARAVKQIKSKSRFLCLTINHMRPEKIVKKVKTIKVAKK